MPRIQFRHLKIKDSLNSVILLVTAAVKKVNFEAFYKNKLQESY